MSQCPAKQVQLAICAATLLAATLALSRAHAAERPNLLLIVTDNQSPGLLGAYGNPDIRTPNIDSLATRGMRFDNAYATSGVCSPTRATLLTGLLPSQTGVHNGLPGRFKVTDWSAIEEFRNLPQTLADAGYRTGMVGKYHLGDHAKAQLGFEFWTTFRGGHTESFVDVEVIDNGTTLNVADIDTHITDYWTRRAVDFVAQQTDDRPFFLMVSYNGPTYCRRRSTNRRTTVMPEYYDANPPTMPQNPVHPYLREWAKSMRMPVKVVGGTYAWAAIDALNNQQAMNKIAAEMTMVDDGVGAVLEALDDSGLADDTVVVFLSDQGSAYGQLGLWGNSSWGAPAPAYRANMQIPLIFRHPGRVPPGSVNNLMIDEFDLFPTLLDYLGLADREIANTPGRSFAQALTGETIDWDDTVFFEYIDTRVIQTRRWKLTKRFLAAPNELYDLAADPGETRNLDRRPWRTGTRRGTGRAPDRSSSTPMPTRVSTSGTAAPRKRPSSTAAATIGSRITLPGWRQPFTEKAEPFRDR